MSETDIIIRDGNLNDAAKVREIAFSTLKSYGVEAEPDGLDFELGHFGESYSGSIAQLVACKQSNIIGSVILRRQSPNDGKMTGFYVDPDYRGQQTGHLLLTEAIRRAKATGLDGIYLDTLDEMESAIWLYKKFGWKWVKDLPDISGTLRNYYLKF